MDPKSFFLYRLMPCLAWVRADELDISVSVSLIIFILSVFYKCKLGLVQKEIKIISPDLEYLYIYT